MKSLSVQTLQIVAKFGKICYHIFMENFENLREAMIKNGAEGAQLLLHSCCAPCSTAVLERLAPHFKITVFYYNPNIDSDEEFLLRMAEQQRFLQCAYPDISLVQEGRCAEDFYSKIVGLEGEAEGGARCLVCFRLRLKRLCEKAKELGILYVSTTLTLSPLKSAEAINRIGRQEAERVGVQWLPCDFKKQNGTLRSIELSRQYALYRQNFCGCEFSKKKINN